MSRRIFEVEHERSARPRNVRDDAPYPLPGTFMPFPQNFGPVVSPHVSEMQVLGIPAANRAVNLIANGVASMAPPKVFAGDDVTELDVPPICARPWAKIIPFAYWHLAVSSWVMNGNFLGVLDDFGPDGYPRQAVPVPTQLVACYYAPRGMETLGFQPGSIVYNVAGLGLLGELDVVHVPNFLLPGSPWGVGPVELFRKSFGLALNQQAYAADTFQSGAVPSGIITTDRPRPDRTDTAQVQEQWIENHGFGQRRPAVLPKEWKFEPLSWSPLDAQFLESRQFTVAEIALIIGLAPSDLGAAIGGSSLTYSNIEQQQIARVTDSYGPPMRRFEQTWSDLIPADSYMRFKPENLFRTDAKTLAEVNQLNIASGVTDPAEARAEQGKKPLPKPPPVAEKIGPDGLPIPAGPEGIPGAPLLEAKPVSVKV